MSNKIIRVLPFLLWPLIASGLSLAFAANILGSLILFFVVPAVYLTIVLKKLVLKAFLFSVVTAFPLGIIWDYVAHLNEDWMATSIFPFRLFELVVIEDILWVFVLIYFVILFYEYFLDSHRDAQRWHPRMRFLVWLFVILFAVFVLLYLVFPRALYIPYFYFWASLMVLVIPSCMELFRRPRLLPKFLVAGAYFFFLNFVYEITALKLGQWNFPGAYVGTISLGGVEFPFEEFFLMAGAIAILSYYEPFDDDEK